MVVGAEFSGIARRSGFDGGCRISNAVCRSSVSGGGVFLDFQIFFGDVTKGFLFMGKREEGGRNEEQDKVEWVRTIKRELVVASRAKASLQRKLGCAAETSARGFSSLRPPLR